ncbi:MAG: pitrilysin family protein [Micrococcus sp.]|nr:pitrilysin family protein [Micrococcus sp.]
MTASPTDTQTQIPLDFTGTIADDAAGAVVRRSVLPGGVRVLTESMPNQRSVTVGFWVAVGSRDEFAHGYGSTHFLEHLLFKGTPTRSALDIAAAFDRVGGESNAGTAKESTVYHARVLDEDLPMAIDVLADMVAASVIDAGEMETERGVILEELAMDADDPVDVAHEKLAEVVLGQHPLARPIGGTPETIRGVEREHVWDHYQHWYRADELVVTAAGGLDHDAVCALVAASLSRAGWDLPDGATPAPRRAVDTEAAARASIAVGTHTVTKPVEQAHVIVGGRSLATADDDRYTLGVMSTILGGGMSSRLFQEIRERRGLAYSTYAFTAGYSDVGYFGLYAGCQPGRVDEVAALMEAELERMASEPVTAEELDRAHGQICGGTVLGMESTGARMSRLGRAELSTGEFTGMTEALERVRAVGADEVMAVAARLAGSERARVVVGPSTM